MPTGIIYVSGNLGKFARFEVSSGANFYVIECKRKWSFNISQFNKHVKLQYFEVRHDIKSIIGISLKRLVHDFLMYPEITFYFLFHRYKIIVPEEINEKPNILVKYISVNKKYYPWVSRLAQLQGVFSITNDQNLEWDMFRFSERFVCYILERLEYNSKADSKSLLSLDLPIGELKVKNIKQLSTPNDGDLKVIELNNVIVDNLAGVIDDETYFPINRFHYQENVSRPTDLLFNHNERMYVYKFGRLRTISINSALLIPYSNNWYHLVIEGVGPYLSVFTALKNLPILIPSDAPKNIVALLHEISGVNPIQIQPGDSLNVGQLSIIQDWRYSERFNFKSRSEDIKKINEFFKSKPSKETSNLNILFTRKSNLFRQVTNIQQLQKYLTLKDFKVVDPSEISVEETKELISNAAIVICETGAAITNLIMCQDKIDFIELNPDNFDSKFWKGFCDELSVTHHTIKMKRSLRKRGYYQLPIRALDKMLNQIANK